MSTPGTPVLPIDWLRLQFTHRPDIIAAIDAVEAAGLAEYGEPLSPSSTINGAIATPQTALTEALNETIDAAVYAYLVMVMVQGADEDGTPSYDPRNGPLYTAAIHLKGAIAALADAQRIAAVTL